jgi:hypothetical protein
MLIEVTQMIVPSITVKTSKLHQVSIKCCFSHTVTNTPQCMILTQGLLLLSEAQTVLLYWYIQLLGSKCKNCHETYI